MENVHDTGNFVNGFEPNYDLGAGLVESLNELQARLPELPPSGMTPTDKALRELHAKLSEQAKALISFANSQDPTEDAQARAAKIQQAVEKLKSDAEAAAVRLEVLRAEERYGTELAFQQNDGLEFGPFDAELRKVLRDMPPSKRTEFVSQALEAGDKVTLAAVLKAPYVLSGVDAKTHAQFTEAWRQKVCPGICQARARHEETATNLQAVLELAGQAVKTFHGQTGQRNIAQARQKAAQAAERLQASNSVVPHMGRA